MIDTKINFCGIEFKNPIVTASGTFGFGEEYGEYVSLSEYGGFGAKGLTRYPREGNPPPRIAETASGILNSVGLQNPGVEKFVSEDLGWLKQQNTVVIANAAGHSLEDYCKTVEVLETSDVDMIELNLSCPNVKEGGINFGTSCTSVENVTYEIRKRTSKPLIVKLTPNVTDITELALAAESAGADSVSLINTLTGMKIDINTRRPVLRNNTGGLSGRAVLPVAIRMVWQVANKVKIPVIGMGGISTWEDAVEMMLAGASAIQVGTAIFHDVYAPIKIVDGLNAYLDKNGIASVNDIVGKVQVW